MTAVILAYEPAPKEFQDEIRFLIEQQFIQQRILIDAAINHLDEIAVEIDRLCVRLGEHHGR